MNKAIAVSCLLFLVSVFETKSNAAEFVSEEVQLKKTLKFLIEDNKEIRDEIKNLNAKILRLEENATFASRIDTNSSQKSGKTENIIMHEEHKTSKKSKSKNKKVLKRDSSDLNTTVKEIPFATGENTKNGK